MRERLSVFDVRLKSYSDQLKDFVINIVHALLGNWWLGVSCSKNKSACLPLGTNHEICVLFDMWFASNFVIWCCTAFYAHYESFLSMFLLNFFFRNSVIQCWRFRFVYFIGLDASANVRSAEVSLVCLQLNLCFQGRLV